MPVHVKVSRSFDQNSALRVAIEKLAASGTIATLSKVQEYRTNWTFIFTTTR